MDNAPKSQTKSYHLSGMWHRVWDGRWGAALAWAVLLGVLGLLLFGNLSGLGVWEPWEATEILVAQEYSERLGSEITSEREGEPNRDTRPTLEFAPGEERLERAAKADPNWAMLTLEADPVDRSLLKTWLISASIGQTSDLHSEVGELERRARGPIAVFVSLLVLLVFVWLRAYFDTWSCLLAALVLASTPAIYLGTHILSSEMLLVVTTSVALLAYFQIIYTTSSVRWVWGGVMGFSLALAFADQRAFGLMIPLATMACFGLSQLPFEEIARQRRAPDQHPLPGKLPAALAATALLGAAALLTWAFNSADGESQRHFLSVASWRVAALGVPVLLVLAGSFFAMRTTAVKALVTGPGLLGLGIPAIAVAALVSAWSEALPDTTALLGHLLVREVPADTVVSSESHFAIWVRQIGFAMVPWSALVPLGLGYLARSARLHDDQAEARQKRTIREGLIGPVESLKRMLLVWALVALVVTALASSFGHYFYAGYVPLAVGVGIMFGDRAFWRDARLQSTLVHAMGFLGIATIMMLGKDLERFPARLLEAYLDFQQDLGLPEDFGYGTPLKLLKYGWAALLAVYFFGLVSWVTLTWRDLRALPAKISRWRRGATHLRNGGEYGANHLDQGGGENGATHLSDGASDGATHLSDSGENGATYLSNSGENGATHLSNGDTQRFSPMRARILAKEAFHRESDVSSWLARAVERPGPASGLIAAAGVATAVVILYMFMPTLSAHLSQRGLFETYVSHASADEPLYRYRVANSDPSVYMRGVESIPNARAFLDRFDEEDRFFAVIPRDQLARINSDVRRRFKRNLPVLNARSSRLLLVSNKHEEGEPEQNFVADQIIDESDFEPRYPLWFSEDGRMQRASFDGQIELLGYDLDREVASGAGLPTYEWGDDVTLTLYFRVKRRVSGQQKIFLHVDYPGNRIHGDHDPAGGEFATNHWLPGDIIRDEYTLKVENYSSPGVYSINFGFFRGDRMKVMPAQAHDGSNRVMVGKIRIRGPL